MLNKTNGEKSGDTGTNIFLKNMALEKSEACSIGKRLSGIKLTTKNGKTAASKKIAQTKFTAKKKTCELEQTYHQTKSKLMV